jgi:hypothetical protein
MPLSFSFDVMALMIVCRVHLAGELAASVRPQSRKPDASVPRDRRPSSRMSYRVCSLGLNRLDYFVHLGAPELVGQPGMLQIGFVCVSSINGRIYQPRTVPAQSF